MRLIIVSDTRGLVVERGPVGTRFFAVHRFVSIDSTNRYLLDLGSTDPTVDGVVAIADHQTAGRGRRGRVWDARPNSSLLFSVLLQPRAGLSPVLMSHAMGLAVIDACESVGGLSATLKWPNDVLVGERKLAGVLAEAVTSGGEIQAVVVGCGLNLNWQGRLPPPLRDGAVSADEVAGRAIDRDSLLSAILRSLDQWLNAEPADLSAAYRKACGTLGRTVRVELADGTKEGTVEDIDADGALVLRCADGSTSTVIYGDVVHLRPN